MSDKPVPFDGGFLDEAIARGEMKGAELLDELGPYVNLPGVDLRGLHLRGFDLTSAYLEDANLRGADLSNAVLVGANLRGADLTDVALVGANHEGANLRGADLTDVAPASGAWFPGLGATTEIVVAHSTDPEEISEFESFQLRTYVDYGFLSSEESSEAQRNNDRSDRSDYILAWSEGELIGGLRLTRDGEGGLFALDQSALYPEASEILPDRSSIVEVSGLSIARGKGRFAISVALYRGLAQHALTRIGTEHLVAVVDPALLRILTRLLNVPVATIGHSKEVGNRMRAPVYIDLLQALSHLRAVSPEEHRFFIDGMVIDLRETRDRSLSTVWSR